jgi:hypothetical protein
VNAAPLGIGVTGHRDVRETPALTAALDQVFARVERAFPRRAWVLLSSLAEGADQIVARKALCRPETTLEVPLPLPEADYLPAFSGLAGRQGFTELLNRAGRIVRMPPATNHPEAYRLAGIHILERCDVLITLWDGLPARGVGGTGEIVAEARRHKIPLAWVHLDGNAPTVTFEGFPDS